MIKIFSLYRRKPDADAGQFLDGITEAVRKLDGAPGILGFNVQKPQPIPARKDIVQLDVPGDVDAFVEFWTASVADYDAFLESETGQSWRAELKRLARDGKTLVLKEQPKMPVPSPRPPRRNNAFLSRNPRFATLEDFRHEWHVGHGDMCFTVPHQRAFIPCDVIDVLAQKDLPEMPTAQIDGIAQAFFDSEEDEYKMVASAPAKEWFKHGATTFGYIRAFGATETVVKAPEA